MKDTLCKRHQLEQERDPLICKKRDTDLSDREFVMRDQEEEISKKKKVKKKGEKDKEEKRKEIWEEERRKAIIKRNKPTNQCRERKGVGVLPKKINYFLLKKNKKVRIF